MATSSQTKMNPKAYVKQQEREEKMKDKTIRIATQIVERNQRQEARSGRKSKAEREAEERLKDRMKFLLFLEKESDTDTE
jgi:hypothetical protein